MVRSRRGAIHPHRPVSAIRAGSRVTAAKNTTAIEMASAGPIVDNMPNRANTMQAKVTATVAAEAAITLPTEVSAPTTARFDGAPCRR
ncbi:hypothetical protein C1Y40_02831 [Mycobacterium talmoniae]|uniref:Uncharacterized protein n=1 Tax=Mycobacterium talmoniae TaxID=1858794 RepID=A0A2S8BJZ3_9MYCO|nr:hypothetical protein C1Y40_02831 [Mycobacterium talmoniae]